MTIREAFEQWEFEGTQFYLRLEEKLRKHKDSYISRALRQTYQVAVKMVATASKTMEGFTTHTEDRVTRGALPLNKTFEFWMAAVNLFWALYEVSGTFVYSMDDKVKVTPMNA